MADFEINESDGELVARRDKILKKMRADAKKRKMRKKKNKSVGDKLNENRTGLGSVMNELRKQNGQ